FGKAAGDRDQWTKFIHPPTIDRALRGEVVRRCGHQDVVAREPDRGAIRGMKATLFDGPCSPTVAAGTEADRGRGHYDAWTARFPRPRSRASRVRRPSRGR